MNPAHLHLILNHLPVLGTAFSLATLAYGLGRRAEELKRFGLALLLLSGLFAIPTFLTGEPAEGAVKGLSGVASGRIEQHEEAAGVALTASLALGTFALIGVAMFRRERKVAAWFSTTALVGAVAVTGLMAWTANLGGQIHHPELRSPEKPIQASRPLPPVAVNDLR